MWLDVWVYGFVIILDGDGVNLCIDFGITVIEFMTLVLVGIESLLVKEYNVFLF